MKKRNRVPKAPKNYGSGARKAVKSATFKDVAMSYFAAAAKGALPAFENVVKGGAYTRDTLDKAGEYAKVEFNDNGLNELVAKVGPAPTVRGKQLPEIGATRTYKPQAFRGGNLVCRIPVNMLAGVDKKHPVVARFERDKIILQPQQTAAAA